MDELKKSMISTALTHWLSQLQALVRDLEGQNSDAQGWQVSFLDLHQRFQQEILPQVMAADLTPERRSQVQPLLTEMNRSLRLLAMDMAFLNTARQAPKVEQRVQQMVQRMQSLWAFGEGLQAALAEAGA